MIRSLWFSASRQRNELGDTANQVSLFPGQQRHVQPRVDRSPHAGLFTGPRLTPKSIMRRRDTAWPIRWCRATNDNPHRRANVRGRHRRLGRGNYMPVPLHRSEWTKYGPDVIAALCPNGVGCLDSGISLSAGARRWLRIWRRSLGDPEGNPFVEQTAPASGSP
jgi:hypothetical protein